VTEILSQFRDEALPPSTIDIDRAVAVGRRRRTRTRLAAVGVVVALALGGAATPFLISAEPGPEPTPPTCGSPEPTRPSVPTWQRFDPLTYEIDASGVTGYRVTTFATSTSAQLVNMQPDGFAGNQDVGVLVLLYSCAGQPHHYEGERSVPFDPGAGEAADPIGGRPTYWVASNTVLPGGLPSEGLVWQWTDGAWVIVLAEQDADVTPAVPAALRDIAAHVAPQLRLGVGTAVKAPFAMPVPEDTAPLYTHTVLAEDFGRSFAVSFSIGFDPVEKPVPGNIFDAYVPSLTVTANAFAQADDRPDNATEYPEDLGHPAYQTTDTVGTQEVDILLVYDFFGFGLDIKSVEMPGATTTADRLRQAADIFRSITVYPNAATDQSAWGEPLVP
jgi:hypothetical protein